MITQIRTNFKKNAYRIALWVIVAVLGLSSLPMVMRKATTDGQWALRINGEEISRADYMREVDRQRAYIDHVRSQYGEYADMLLGNININQIALSTVQQEMILNQVADSIGIRIDREFLAEKLYEQVPPYMITQTGIDQKALHKLLARQGLGIRDFERKVERGIAQHIVTDMVSVGYYVPLFELKSLYLARYVDKKLSYLALSLDRYLKEESQKEVKKPELMAFYETKKAEYAVPEKRTGTMWVMDADKFGIHLSDEKIEDYYNKHKTESEYQDKPAQVQIRSIVFTVQDSALKDTMQKEVDLIRTKLVQDPSQFAAEARRLSADKATKDKGGLMPFFAKGEKNSVLERAAFLLKAPGDISEVIETDRGFELIQLVEKQPKTIKSLAMVKDDIKKKLIDNAFKNSFGSEMRKVMVQKEQDAQAVQSFAESKQASQRVLNNVTANGSREVKTLFDIKKAHGIAFYQENGKGFIVQLTDIKHEYIPTLAAIESKVKEDYYKYQAQQALEADLRQIQQLSATQSFEELQKKFGGFVASSDWLDIKNTEMISKFLPKNTPKDFSTSLVRDIEKMEKVGSTVLKITNDSGIVLKVNALKEFDIADFELKKESLAQEVERTRKRLTEQGFVASLYRNAKIETNDSIVTL